MTFSCFMRSQLLRFKFTQNEKCITITGSALQTGSLIIPSIINENPVTRIGDKAFSGCSKLNGNLTIPSGVTHIGDYAFSGCSGLTGNLTIPASVTSIGAGAFSGCSGLTGNLTIPANVTSIGRSPFAGCSGLTAITVDPLNTYYSSDSGGVLFNKQKTILILCPAGKSGAYTIPSSVTSIADSAFSDCSGLTGNLTLPSSITSIGQNAFCGCSGLIGNLKIPSGVTHIAHNAFRGCSGLNGKLTLPASVTSIGQCAFEGCNRLTGSLTIPSVLRIIGQSAFEGCSGLTGNLTIPSSMTHIGNDAFSGCSGLTVNLPIPSSITNIGKDAFSDCNWLQIWSLRKERRYDEVCALAHDLITADEKNADAWWNLALAQHALEQLDEALESLKVLIKLAPHFADGWAQYGVMLAENSQPDQALKALSHALQVDTNHFLAAREAARICEERKDSDGAIHFLTHLDAVGGANGDDLNKLGIKYHDKNHFGKAIDYYHRSAAKLEIKLENYYPYYNLALLYNHDEVSQDVDAIDCLERALQIYPDYKNAKKLLASIRPRLETLASNVLKEGVWGLTADDCYQFYINPFELLVGGNHEYGIESYDTKNIQRLKKHLLQEIDLEDGRIHYIEGLTIDKSRAIGICDELHDESLKRYHWLVFSEPYLLGFLTRGDIRHFLCLDNYKPMNLLAELENESSGFRGWLSKPFARQYDLVLTRALQKKRVPLVESLFDGRRWILREHEALCFDGAMRQVKQLFDPLRQADEAAKETKPMITKLNDILNNSNLIPIINVLPEPFRDLQNEAVSIIRNIAIKAYNEHGDTDVSKEILSLSRRFSFKSVTLRQRLDEDLTQIERLISQERKHEAKLTIGLETMEITKEGVRKGVKNTRNSTFIAANSVEEILWETTHFQTQNDHSYSFHMKFRDCHGCEIEFSSMSWKPQDFEQTQKSFQNLANAALIYVIPHMCEKIQGKLDSGGEVKIGPCSLSKNALQFEKRGWFTTKQHIIPWNLVETESKGGVLFVYDKSHPRIKTKMPLGQTSNAVLLPILPHILKKSIT